MNKNKADKSPFTSDLERFFIYFIVVVVITVVLTHVSGSSSTSTMTIAENVVLDKKSQEVLPDPTETIAVNSLLEELYPEIINKRISKNDPGSLYYPLVVKISKQYQVDPLLVKAVIAAESGFNPNAVSHVGAEGLMQLMPRTAKSLGVKDSFNPEHNINGGVKYLKKLLVRFDGDVTLALAAYNAGSRNVRKYRGVPPYRETRNYIDKVCRFLNDYKKTESSSNEDSVFSQI